MDLRPDSALLWARAAGVGSMAVFLGVGGHATADGLLPGPLVLAVLVAASVLACVPLLARPASTLRLVAIMVAGQAVVHVVLTLSAGHVGDPVTRGASLTTGGAGPASLPEVGGRRLGSLQEAYDVSSAATAAGPSVPAHLVPDLTSHAPMMVVHLAAAALVGWWIASGERALWHLVAMTGRRLVLAVHLLTAPVVHAPVSRPSAAALLPRPRASLWRSRPDLVRGPPSGVDLPSQLPAHVARCMRLLPAL